MKIAQIYSHLNGVEFLMVHKPVLWNEIQGAIKNVDAGEAFDKINKEKNMVGKTLYSPSKLNKHFSVQYDLHVKHTFFYGRGDIDVGVEIIPMHSLMSQMSSGVAWYENELTNIVREGRSNPSVPIVLIEIEPD